MQAVLYMNTEMKFYGFRVQGRPQSAPKSKPGIAKTKVTN